MLGALRRFLSLRLKPKAAAAPKRGRGPGTDEAGGWTAANVIGPDTVMNVSVSSNLANCPLSPVPRINTEELPRLIPSQLAVSITPAEETKNAPESRLKAPTVGSSPAGAVSTVTTQAVGSVPPHLLVPTARFFMRPDTPSKEKVKSRADAACGASKEPVETARAAMDAPSTANLTIKSSNTHQI